MYVASSLVSEGEKGPVLAVVNLRQKDGTADKSAKLIELVRCAEVGMAGDGIDSTALGEEVGRIELLVAEILVHIPVQTIGTCLGDDAENCPAAAAKLRGRCGGEDLELVDDLDRRRERRLALAADDDGDTIKKNLVRTSNSTVRLKVVCGSGYDSAALRAETGTKAVTRHNSRCERGESIGVAPVQGKFGYLSRADRIAQVRLLRIKLN